MPLHSLFQLTIFVVFLLKDVKMRNANTYKKHLLSKSFTKMLVDYEVSSTLTEFCG